ncbi:hypothetical protein [Arthrobacter sp. OY3WO11]|uniref:hypothetical protein n=1 Tax=Arthrobacter sp. OY3WO11 TaxID=1835723 RepID=UPI0007CFB5DE|nr:hypothetical protein [Arthrobacter sp. OY3WO11]OAD97649.1 hypothetical protein A6A22_19740 [Arthrobacter sp. OY3WO11]
MQDLSSDAASQMFSLDMTRSTVGTTRLLELTSEIRDLPVVQTRLGVESLQQLVVEAVAVKHLVQFMLFVFLMDKVLTPHLKGAAGISALATCRSNKTYVGAKYRRLAARRGPMNALVAVEHSILITVWNMPTTGELYRDPQPDHPSRPKHGHATSISSRHLGYPSSSNWPNNRADQTARLCRMKHRTKVGFSPPVAG